MLNASVVEVPGKGYHLAKERPGAKIDLAAALSFACLAAVRAGGVDVYRELGSFYRKERVRRVLDDHHGNYGSAAIELGIPVAEIQKIVEQYEVLVDGMEDSYNRRLAELGGSPQKCAECGLKLGQAKVQTGRGHVHPECWHKMKSEGRE